MNNLGQPEPMQKNHLKFIHARSQSMQNRESRMHGANRIVYLLVEGAV